MTRRIKRIEEMDFHLPQYVYALKGNMVVAVKAKMKDQKSAVVDEIARRERNRESRKWLRLHKPQLRRAYEKKCAEAGGVNESWFNKQVSHINPFRQTTGPRRVCADQYTRNEADCLKAEIRGVTKALRALATAKASGKTGGRKVTRKMVRRFLKLR